MKGSKVKTLAEVVSLANAARRKGKRIVTTNGCFDILHIGHVRYLEAAKKKGDILIVGVNSDASVRGSKGPSRPIVPERERAEVIASLKAADAVFIFPERDPSKWLSKVKPDIHVKGADWTLDRILEREIVEKGGGRIALIPLEKGKSTTNIVRKILGEKPKKK